MYAFINWEDNGKEFVHQLEGHSGTEIWSGEQITLKDGLYSETIPPHSVRLIEMD